MDVQTDAPNGIGWYIVRNDRPVEKKFLKRDRAMLTAESIPNSEVKELLMDPPHWAVE